MGSNQCQVASFSVGAILITLVDPPSRESTDHGLSVIRLDSSLLSSVFESHVLIF